MLRRICLTTVCLAILGASFGCAGDIPKTETTGGTSVDLNIKNTTVTTPPVATGTPTTLPSKLEDPLGNTMPALTSEQKNKALVLPQKEIDALKNGSKSTAEAKTGAATPIPTPKDSKEVTNPSGLKYIDVVVGKGESPKSGQTVVVHYTGTLTDGTKFDSSKDRGTPFEFPIGVGRVIAGWDEGVATMKVGGVRKLIIPPILGYGSQDQGKIPPNSTLLFDVELLGIK